MRKTMTLVLMSFLLCARLALAQSATPWTVKTTTDPMTDKKMLTATIAAYGANDVKQQLPYELTLTCDGSGHRFDLATFDKTNTAVGEHMSRAIRREIFVQSGSFWTTKFTVRVDESVAEWALIMLEYGNKGSLVAMFSTPMTITVPMDRLVVSGIFPGETIVFPFSTLTPADRAAVSAMCGK